MKRCAISSNIVCDFEQHCVISTRMSHNLPSAGKTSLQAEKHYIKLFQLLKKCNFIFNQQSGIQQHGVISSSMTWYQACVISRNIVFNFKKHCMWFPKTCFKPQMHYCKQKHITQASSIIRRVQFQFQSEKWDSHSIVLCVKQQCMWSHAIEAYVKRKMLLMLDCWCSHTDIWIFWFMILNDKSVFELQLKRSSKQFALEAINHN